MFCYAILCHVLLCSALVSCAMLCFAPLYPSMLCFAVLLFAVLCLAFLCLAMLWFTLLCFAMHGYALKCYAMLCFPLLCFDFEAGSSPSPGSARKCKKFTQFMQQFEPNRKFLEKMTFQTPFWPQSQIPRKNALFGPLCGGDHGRAQKVKNYNKNITENHNEKSRDYF